MTITPGKPSDALVIIRGTTFSKIFTWRDSAGALINLTGYSAVFKARATIEDTATLISLSSPSSGIVLGGAAGTITLNMSDTLTSALTVGKGVWGLAITSGGTKDLLLRGDLIIQENEAR